MADDANEKRSDLIVDSSQNEALGQTKHVHDEKTPDLGSDNRPADENASFNEEGDAESVDSKDELKLSKGRCIALVCTVTGASFLNVSIHAKTHALYKILFTNNLIRPSQAKASLSSSRKLAEPSTCPTRDCNGSSRHMS